MPTKEERNWAMFIHLAQLLNFIFPFLGLIAVVVMWQLKKESPYIDTHGRIVLNWVLSCFVYALAGIALVYIGVGILILLALKIAIIVLAILWAIKANNGETTPYPLSIPFFRI